jgi:hypothetical protein
LSRRSKKPLELVISIQKKNIGRRRKIIYSKNFIKKKIRPGKKFLSKFLGLTIEFVREDTKELCRNKKIGCLNRKKKFDISEK